MSGAEDRRSLDTSRVPDAHQLPGASSSHICSADVCKEHNWDINTTEIGQHISCCIHKQPGRHSLPRAGRTVVPREEHTHHSVAPTRYSEPGSRLEVAHNTRSYGLETEPTMVQEDRPTVGPNRGRFVCNQDHKAVPSLLQLDPHAAATDAFLQDWSLRRGFANPVILMAPVWKTQPWYSLLLGMLVDYPRLLGQMPPIVTRQVQPMIVPQLAVWPISGKSTEMKSFQMKLPLFCLNRDESRQMSLSTHSSANGIAGVIEGVQIPFLVL